MKKSIFTLVAFCFVFFADAQTNDTKQYKQFAGAKNLEVLFAPLGGSPISIGGLKFRTFTSESMAYRANVFLGFSSDSDKAMVTNADGDEVALNTSSSSFTINLRPGVEYHFAGTNRLSPYYGFEGVIGYRSSGSSAETFGADGVEVIKNKVRNPGNDGYFRLGVNALLGADYYVAKNLYLGTEVGFGFQFDIENDHVSVPATGDETTISEGGTSFDFGPNAVGQIRLGFLF